mmetsp:Transcript_104662/g.295765  ORF Transcript_104662/g.295765 Transcript_104662/m.295765 type:complete len:375 (+) Transcript_104662:86-1210(+)
MMDFDDLEETAAERAEDGDEEALRALGATGWNVERPRKWDGRMMQEMRRSPKLPGRHELPGRIQQLRREGDDVSVFQMRLLVFYGGGDSYIMWVPSLNTLPEMLDVGVHEYPGHGVRGDDPLSTDLFELAEDAWSALEPILKQHSRGGRYEGAPFAFLGHSQGILQMIEIAERARRLYLLEPCAVFALDRPPPGPTGCSREGYRLLTLDWPEEFYELQPPLGTMMSDPKQKDLPNTQKIVKMWQNDMRLSNELHTQRPVGFHTFECDVHVFIADKNWDLDRRYQWCKENNPDLVSPELEYQFSQLKKIHDSGEASYFNREAYNLWDQWTTAKAHYHTIDVDHNNLKAHKDMWIQVLKVLHAELKAALAKPLIPP